MKFTDPKAEFHIPDGVPEQVALERATHIAVGAHQDDLEIMAYHGIVECFRSTDNWFLGVTVADGAGSPRAGAYAGTTDAEMQDIRKGEQRRAADIGGYSGIIQLNRASKNVKDATDRTLVDDIRSILERTRPMIVYTHNPADKHDTHVAVALRTVAALRELPPDARPKRVLGCEVWRNLDWLHDSEKVVLDVSGHENLSAALLGVYDSQIAGGKRYDLATMGRWRANASFFASHDTDESTGLSFAMDLTPLINAPEMDVMDFMTSRIKQFAADIADRAERMSKR